MNVLNLLTISETVNSIGVTTITPGELSWIGKIIGWIFNLFSGFYGAVALGVIVFTIILKTIVLPLDIYSRVKTKKQSLLMEKMRPQMEKLQKQYANDQNMYSQKVLELQRANGYNPIGACLPMIISLVVFMVILGSFSTYSNYAVLNNYKEMADAYNQSVSVYVRTDESDDNSRFLIEYGDGYKVDFAAFSAYYAPIYDEAHSGDEEKVPFDEYFNGKTEGEKWEIVLDYVSLNARDAAAEWYNDNKAATSFGWIGNLWYPDSMLNKEVPDYAKFSSSATRAMNTGDAYVLETDYNEVTYNLSKEKDTYNGYFVLIILSIGFMFLQQFIMSRSQKAANELSTVDGNAAKTNKWMMIIMPIIFGLFSFMYSAAFSMYMITNTIYGLVSTLIINKIVTVRYEKKDIASIQNKRPTNKAKRLK